MHKTLCMHRFLGAYVRCFAHLSIYHTAVTLVHVSSVLYIPTKKCLQLIKRFVNYLSVNVNP